MLSVSYKIMLVSSIVYDIYKQIGLIQKNTAII